MSLHFCKIHSPGWLLAVQRCYLPGESQLPIIHFLMEFRLRPVAGLGEDWVSLVIPHRQGAELQTYLLQGLTPGDSATVLRPGGVTIRADANDYSAMISQGTFHG